MNKLLSLAAAALLTLPLPTPARASVSAPPVIVALTQVPCQFLESEHGQDHGYRSTNIKDCEAINARTAGARLQTAKTLELKPGKYIFRVTNRNVPYELGFWLRGAGIAGRVTLPSVSGGGLLPGKTQDYAIELTPGEYLYSCPLNTTPDYKLVVK
jgi:hypothetical protein